MIAIAVKGFPTYTYKQGNRLGEPSDSPKVHVEISGANTKSSSFGFSGEGISPPC